MVSFYPVLFVGALLGVVATIFIVAFAISKRKLEDIKERKMSDKEILIRLIRYAKKYKFSFIISFFLMAFAIANEIASPIVVGQIEELIKHEGFEFNRLLLYIFLYAGIVSLSFVALYLQTMILQKAGQKIIREMREDLFSHIESLSHAQLNDIPVGKLVTRVTNDIDGISLAFTTILVNLLKNMFILLGITIAMLIINYALALIVLCLVPFIVFFTIIFRHFSRKAHRKVRNANTDINTFLSEHLSGIKVVQIFNKEKDKQAEFEVKNKELESARREQMIVFGIFMPLIYVMYACSVLLVIFFCTKGYLDNFSLLGQKIDSGVLVTFYMYVGNFFNPIFRLSEQFNRLQAAFASCEKIFAIMDMKPTVVDAEDAIELESVRGEIEFKDVWFAYKEDEWVLKGVSFKVLPSQTVAFVGSTGSGKTTILSLLCRNYDIQKGVITVDGIDIRKIKIASLRHHFGQMLQDVFLFSGTIKDNITLFSDFSDEEIKESCELVNADSFINKLPKGVEEEVRERGNNFSSGQRQLISFARTVIHKPEVMILDEATANIDTETEVIIQNSLEKMMSIGTMLVVAHRLSTIQKADNIIVISHGQIVEQGSHNELLHQKGRYYKLYTLQ